VSTVWLELKLRYPNDVDIGQVYLDAFGYPKDIPDLRTHRPPGGNALPAGRALHDPERKREAACQIVQAKVASQIKAAEHYQRHREVDLRSALRLLRELPGRCPTASVASLRGIEGAGSAAWFGVLGQLFQPPWTFPGRVRRPPTDPVNALLSLGYTFLLTRVTTACEAAGLEVQLGALHEFRPGRPSLACDLMESLRVPAVDRWVILLCNQNRVGVDQFVKDDETGGLRLERSAFQEVLRDWEQHWQGGHEEALQQQVEEFVTWLRQNEPAVAPDEDFGAE